jgi:hypothetical protein
MGLGVVDKIKWASAKFRVYSMWFSFVAIGPKKSADQNRKHTMNVEQQTGHLSFVKGRCRASVFQVVEHWDLCSNVTLNGGVWALKWGKNKKSIASRLGNPAILTLRIYFTITLYKHTQLNSLPSTNEQRTRTEVLYIGSLQTIPANVKLSHYRPG